MDESIILDEKENSVLLSVDSKIYSLDVIYTAAYVFLERAYLVLDGNPNKKILIKITAKEKCTLKDLGVLGKEFLNELINYGFYKKQSEQSKNIKETILQRALFYDFCEKRKFKKKSGDSFNVDSEKIKDPEGIAIPWEKKYRNGNRLRE